MTQQPAGTSLVYGRGVTDIRLVVPASTHEVEIGADCVTKRYRSWGRGEPQREWSALALLGEHLPGLAPVPLEARLDAVPPTIVMQRLPGQPVGTKPVDAAQLDAVVTALDHLHAGIPSEVVARLPPRIWHPAATLAEVRAWLARCPSVGGHPAVRAARTASTDWLGQPALDAVILAGEPVLGRGDGNLANHLWDGRVVRLVDFEDSGRSDRVFEVADVVEHLATRAAGVEPDQLLDRFTFDRTEVGRLREHRRLFATFWFLMLLPGGPAAARNPPGTLERQANHLLDLFA